MNKPDESCLCSLATQVDRKQVIIIMMRLMRGELKKRIIQHMYLKYLWGFGFMHVSLCGSLPLACDMNLEKLGISEGYLQIFPNLPVLEHYSKSCKIVAYPVMNALKICSYRLFQVKYSCD